MELVIQYGLTSDTLKVGDDQIVKSHRKVDPQPCASVATSLEHALREPVEFPPLIAALTPDDQIAMVIDQELGELKTLVAATIRHLEPAGIQPNQITVVMSHLASRSDLASAWPGSRIERHDPQHRERLAYVASTKAGRRIYMNRTVAEADQIIVIAQARFGLSAGRWLYPMLSDHPDEVASDRSELDDEIKEVCWLLGLPFFINVIPSSGDSISEILAGPMDSFRTVKQHLNERWRLQVDRMADTTIACISGSASSVSITDLARAAHNAARVTEPNGTVIVILEGAPELDAGFSLLKQAPTIAAAIKSVPKEQVAAHHWLNIVKQHRVYVMSGYLDEAVEELFATPIQSINQLQKLISGSKSVVCLADAHRSHATTES